MVTIKEKNFGGKLMKNKNELNFKDLKMTCDTKIFDFAIIMLEKMLRGSSVGSTELYQSTRPSATEPAIFAGNKIQ